MRIQPRIIIATIVVGAALGFSLGPSCALATARGQAQPRESTMEQRLDQLRAALATGDCNAVKAALDLILDGVAANMRVVITKGQGQDVTTRANQMLNDLEMKTAQDLARFIERGNCPEERGRALDIKLLLEQQNEVARAVNPFTSQCGDGDDVRRPPCDQLQTELDEETGHELHGQLPPGRLIIKPGYFVKLRGPFVPPYIRHIQEDVRVTQPIAPGQCVVVFKETKGLMLRLIFVRMSVVLDPWATPLLARGTRIPVWALQWVPAEHVKEWNICNIGAGRIRKTVTQRVKQEVPLNYFWRYYPKDP